MTDIEKLIQRLVQGKEYAGRVADYRYLPPVAPRFYELDSSYPPAVQNAVKKSGVERLFSHQHQALELIRLGKHTGITTPTASGKTLIYNMAVTEVLLREPAAHALYLFPLKALAQDQLKTLKTFFEHAGDPELTVAVYDGDTPAGERARLKRKLPRVIITNPDMLHFGMLAYPESWLEFFNNLRVLVIDEAHSYRGVFGSHVSLILRRLRRFCGGPGPTLIASSATMANAREFLQTLAGLPFEVITESGAPRQGRHVILLNPIGSPYSEAASVLQACLNHEIKTIVFTKSRKITELIHIWVREALPGKEKKIAAYRAGYLPEERREIERRLFRDELSAVISTSALEAGIDVGGLDAVLLVGYPGTMISTWQRVGRAGRQERDALMVLIALPDALDQYFLRHPEVFFSSHFENCVLDPDNHDILRQHLPCAAKEKPLTQADAMFFGPDAARLIAALAQEGILQENAQGTEWYSSQRVPHRGVDIRSAGEQYDIQHDRDGKILGSIDGARAFKECHPGAIYLHGGVQYEVVGLQLDLRLILVRETDADWYTQYTSSEEIEILNLASDQKVIGSGEGFQAGLVQVRVTEKIVSYERHRVRDQSLLSEHKLDLPPRVFETQAVLLTVPDTWRKRCLEFSLDFSGGLHAAEHSLIAALPVEILCDRWDVGGLSTLAHPQVAQPCIFIYDGFPGGVGLARKALEVIAQWAQTAREIVSGCECEDGCPACIHSPKCGSGNKPLDKQACRMLLEAMTRKPFQALKLAAKGIFTYARLQPPLPSPPKAAIPAEEPPVLPEWSGAKPGKQLLVFDLETQRSAAEVGGWGFSNRMGMSVGVVYDHVTKQCTAYRETEVQGLIQCLLAADWVVGFNIDRFDLAVLSQYSPHVARVRTVDILKDVHQALGFRLSLNHLAQHTLGREKTAEGLQAIAWFQQGRWQELEAYCQADVEITRDLFFFGLQYGYLLYEKDGLVRKLPVSWKERYPELAQ